DRDRAGVDDAVDPGEPCRLKAIVHAKHVELEGDARRQIAADVIGEVDHPVGFRLNDPRLEIVELAEIAAHHADLFAVGRVVGGLRVDVHDHDLFAALDEKRDQTTADNPGAAGDKGGHG